MLQNEKQPSSTEELLKLVLAQGEVIRRQLKKLRYVNFDICIFSVLVVSAVSYLANRPRICLIYLPHMFFLKHITSKLKHTTKKISDVCTVGRNPENLVILYIKFMPFMIYPLDYII